MPTVPSPDADAIDALLPQTQCTQCGFDGCRPYAEALASGAAEINRCPPGGQAGVERLARLLALPELALDENRGRATPPSVAVIDEATCIGCTLCIQACPVDAIVGAAKRMHTVLLDECTGCLLCVPPCPVDCIAIVPVETLRHQGWEVAERPPEQWRARADRARTRSLERKTRLVRESREREARLAAKAVAKLASLAGDDAATQRKRATVAAAVERARQRRGSEGGNA